LEESNRIEDALATHAAPGRAILVDCLTLWLSTLLLRGENIHDRVRALAAMLPRLPGSVVLVSNEVGWGIVPDNALARRFRDEAGRLHQEIAAIAQRVYLVVAGLDMLIKGDIHENTGDNRDRFSRRGKDDPAHAHAERGAKERPSARLPDQ
jgi:adenosylcobinamide kinase/adenosylcobinamide-phosphate guanylyltransferase